MPAFLKAIAAYCPRCLLNSAREFSIETLRLVHHIDFPVVGQATGTPSDNAQEAVAAENNHGHVRVNHLGLRTSAWTHRLKPVPTTRRRHAHCWLSATPASTEDNVHESATTEHGPNLCAARPTKHRLRRQHSRAHSCTWHHASCSSRITYCTLNSIIKGHRFKIKILKAYDCERSAAFLRMATAIACANTHSNSMHLSLDATSPRPRHNAREPLGSEVKSGDTQVNHGKPRTWHWTQRLEPLPDTAQAWTTHNTQNIIYDAQHTTAQSDTFHHRGCNRRITYCTSSFVTVVLVPRWVVVVVTTSHASHRRRRYRQQAGDRRYRTKICA